MSVAWVAGSIRSAAMARRRLGSAAARTMAGGDLAGAMQILARSPYGREVRPDDGLATAERGIAATALWNLRVLAGWLPAEGVRMLRLAAGWFEIANIDEHLRGLGPTAGDAPVTPFRLGALATAWPRLSTAGSAAELRASLAASAWGDPGDDSPSAISLWLRVSWAERIAAGISAARPWAAGALALLVAREQMAAGRSIPQPVRPAITRMLGDAWARPAGVTDLAGRLPTPARWVLDGVSDPVDLWRAEARWWHRLRDDGRTLLAGSGFDSRRPLGAVALLAADAWLARAALEIAAHGGGGEVFDAVG